MSEVPPQIPVFSPEDLVNAIKLIDEAVNQGSYKGWEAIQMAIAVRARLLLFAQHWQATIDAQKPAEEAEAPAAEETSEEAPKAKRTRSKKAGA